MDDFPGNLPGNSHAEKLKKQQEVSETAEASEDTGPIPSAQKQYDEQKIDVPEDEPGKVKKVVTGKVTTRRKSLSAQFKDMFASENERSFMSYLYTDVVIPMVQEMIVNTVAQTLDGIKNGVEDRVTGGRTQRTSSRTTSYGTGRPVINYNAQYRSSATRPVARPSAPPPRMVIRRSNRVRDIFFETREDGLDVLDELKDKIRGFGHCTVGDLYAAVGETPKSTDQSWGWDDLEVARIRRLATGQFELVLPRPIDIDFES